MNDVVALHKDKVSDEEISYLHAILLKCEKDSEIFRISSEQVRSPRVASLLKVLHQDELMKIDRVAPFIKHEMRHGSEEFS